MVEFEVPEIDYDRYSNRQLAAVPLAVLGVSLLVLVAWYFLNGTPVPLGFDFTGGTELRIVADASKSEIQQAFDADVAAVRPVQGSNEYIVTFTTTNQQQLVTAAESAGFEVLSQNVRSGAFGSVNQRNTLVGLGIAFVGMSLLVFLLFRTFVPSIAVVISAFSDIIIPLALMNVMAAIGLMNIELSLGTVAALLMLIGYSVDSDILLNNHTLRRRGGFYESTYRAMQTGVTMTVTSISAMIVMTIVATLFSIPLLPDIGIILVFGLTADLMNTYMLNLSLLRWYKFEGVAR